MFSKIYAKILGHPFFYDHIRPLIVGGQDESKAYELLDVTKDDIVLDVGCSTGVFFNNCQIFKEYHGVDIDGKALEACRDAAEKHQLGNCRFYQEIVTGEMVRKIRPTKVVLGGLLHFLPDEDIHALLGALIQSDRLEGIVSYDAAYYPRAYINNFFSYITRGKHNRAPQGYIDLVEQHPIKVEKVFHITTGNGAMTLHGMHMIPAKAAD